MTVDENAIVKIRKDMPLELAALIGCGAIAFAREVAGRMDNEAEARRATSLLYHVASAVTFAWEGSPHP